MAQQIQWGNVTFLLNQDRFEQGYQHGRRYYFEDRSQEMQPPESIMVPELLRLVAVPDEQGRYQLDDGVEVTAFGEGVEELLGVLIGYVSGPLHPETPEEREEREVEYVVVVPETVTVG